MPRHLLLIEWIDAERHTSWVSPEDASKLRVESTYSVGVFIKEDKSGVWIAGDWGASPADELGRIMFIPAGTIKRRSRVRCKT